MNVSDMNNEDISKVGDSFEEFKSVDDVVQFYEPPY